MSYTPMEIEKFDEIKDKILNDIQKYYELAHKAVNEDHWNDIHKEKVRDSIIKLMEFEKLMA